MKRSIISSLALFVCAIIPLSAAVRYVPDDYPAIQGAINDCNNGDVIIVKPGTYVENINFHGKNITVTSTNPEDSNIVAATIIDGNNTGSVVTFNNGETSEAILTGFTITRGSSSQGSGIICQNASPVISCNVITDNHSQLNFDAGISVTDGGGIYTSNSNAIITRNIIKNNSAYYGGGIESYSEASIICNNIIRDNRAVFGGGLRLSYGGYLINNTINNNDVSYGDSTNRTTGMGSNLYAIYYSSYAKMVISGNIICNGKSSYGICYYDSTYGLLTFSCNDVWSNSNGNYYNESFGLTDLTGINGNISQDPLFLDNYRIGTNSPCFNAGNPDYIPYLWQRDIDGQYAVMGACADIGADEVPGNPRPVADAGQDQYFKEMVSNIKLDGTGSYDPSGEALSWIWQQTGGTSVTLSNSDTSEPNFIPSGEDVYYFRLTVFDGNNYSQADNVMIVVGNRAPIANAGSDNICRPGQQFTLNGSGSYDLDEGDVLSYSWSQISGPAIELAAANTSRPHFTPGKTGEYVFELIVSDTEASGLPDTVTITCTFGSEPDAYGYSWIDSDNPYGPAFNWIDISNARTKITNLENALEQSFGPYQLGFNFNFYGKTYNSYYIQSDGLISFGSAGITYTNQTIPRADGYDNIIAWMWSLLYPLTDSVIYYKSFKDYYVIQFENYTTYNNSGFVNAEVILYKSGKIVIQYKDFTGGSYQSSYTIGIENSDGTVGTQVAYNDYDYLHDRLAIEFSLGGPYEPVAHAGPDQEYKTPVMITLDGTGSFDRDQNDVLTYQWTQTSGPTVTLSSPTAAKPTFTPGTEGQYTFRLVVSDGTYTSVPDEVTVYIGNRTPIADAGKNKACEPNQVTSLDGSGSYDPDEHDVLSYTWTQVSGPVVNITNANSKYPSLVPAIRGEYVFELVVSDGVEQSLPDTVTVICGMGSAPDEYGYHWIDNSGSWGSRFEWIDIQNTGIRVGGIQNVIEESFGPFPLGFNFNFYGNTYDSFYIQLEGAISFGSNPIPYNNMRIPQVDGYNNMIAWMWTLMYPLTDSKLYYELFDGYAVIQFVDFTAYFNNNATINAEVIIYKSGKIKLQYKDITSEEYITQFTIGIENADGTIGTEIAYNKSNFLHDGMTIEFSTGSYLPTAEAGENQYLSRSALVTLDGSKSYTYDSSGIKEYHWKQVEGPSVTLSDANSMQPVFTADSETQYRFELVVSDSISQSQPDEVLIVVHDVSPVANAGPDRLIQDTLSEVTLNGQGSYDPLGDAITYSWTQTAGPVVDLNDSDTSNPNFVPTEFGIYEFVLIVSDRFTNSTPSTVTIVLSDGFFPVADAGLTVYSDGDSVTLDGTRSFDRDGLPEKLIYSWVQTAGPSVVITDTNSAKPVISGIKQNDSIQVCKFELVVSDGQYMSFPDTVELKIVPKHIASPLRIESGSFDPQKPTIVFFNGGDGTYGSGSWSYSSDWLAKSNALCFYQYGPDSESTRNYQYHADILICYLSRIAPNYNKPIQTMGYSTGGQPAMDTAVRMNLTYKDARYAINRVALIDVCCKDYTQDIADFTTKPVDGEQSWVDAYIGTVGSFNPGALSTKTGEDHSTPSLWYKNSLSGADMNVFNGGIISGGYWSVIGPGKNFQLSRSHVNEQIYRYRWNGSQTEGNMTFYDEALYPGRMLGLVTLLEPYGMEDANGICFSCLPCQNAVGYQVLVGTDPNRVMDFKVVSDTPEPPKSLITEFPSEKFWWTIRAYDIYDSNIYADPKPVSLSTMSLSIKNLTSKTTHTTIQNAINSAVSGDTLQVAPGVYYENINYLNKNLKIVSTDPNDPAVIASTVIESKTDSPAVTISGSHDENCLLSGFTITGKNTGVYCGDFSSPTISKCKISGNTLHGINLYSGCEPRLLSCDIINNSGSGINMELTNGRIKYENFPTIKNCIISGNKQNGITKGRPTIINCTIADNIQGGLNIAGAFVTNSIIYFNGDGSAAAQVSGDPNLITYSDVQGSFSGTGNLDSDPLFADHVHGDYHLISQTGRWDAINLIWVQDASSSPCIDTGDPNSDIGQEPAPNGSRINMGAYGGTAQASKSP